MSLKIFNYNQPLRLESGKELNNLQIGYHTFGKLNAAQDNVIWVCHALTGNSDVFEWWTGLFGENQIFNAEEYFIVCANVLGSPYGTSNPLHNHPTLKQPYYLTFPEFTIRDMVTVHRLLAEELGITHIHTLIGGSLGGQQALEWAIIEPQRAHNLIIVAANAKNSPWAIALNESQRLAIAADRTFYAQLPTGGQRGLKAARSMALLSYRSYQTYVRTQLDEDLNKLDNFKASSYQSYQGEKLVNRFNAYSYWYLSKAMDSHNVGRGRGSVEDALGSIIAKTLVIGVSSDLLFPVDEQKFLANHIPQAIYQEIQSLYGHDGFLIETATLSFIIRQFFKQ